MQQCHEIEWSMLFDCLAILAMVQRFYRHNAPAHAKFIIQRHIWICIVFVWIMKVDEMLLKKKNYISNTRTAKKTDSIIMSRPTRRLSQIILIKICNRQSVCFFLPKSNYYQFSMKIALWPNVKKMVAAKITTENFL